MKKTVGVLTAIGLCCSILVGCGSKQTNLSSTTISTTTLSSTADSSLVSSFISSKQEISSKKSVSVSTSSKKTSVSTSSKRNTVTSSKYNTSSKTKTTSSKSNSNDTALRSTKPITPNYDKKPAKILILGNSFVASSNIKYILDTLNSENKQKLEVTGESVGFYSVTKYYIHLADYPLITDGYYDVIFLCGIFGAEDYVNVEKFVQEIKNTKTKVVLFPAENEYPLGIEQAFKDNKSIGLAYWLKATNTLYQKGFSKLDLCINDEYMHTNQLGGYLGASMIYSYLFQKKPSDTISDFMINNFSDLIPGNSQSEKESKLEVIRNVAYDTIFK